MPSLQMHYGGIWDLTQEYFGIETSDGGSTSPSVLIPVQGEIPILSGIEAGMLHERQ